MKIWSGAASIQTLNNKLHIMLSSRQMKFTQQKLSHMPHYVPQHGRYRRIDKFLIQVDKHGRSLQ